MLFCVLVAPSFAELTDADLDKIRLIVKEEVAKELTKELAPIKADIAQLDDRLRKVEIAIGSLTGRIDGVEKQVTHVTNVTYGLIALIVVAIGIPAWRGKRDRDQERKIETLIQAQERKIEVLTEELQALKAQQDPSAATSQSLPADT